ncbi:Putative NADH dehydrogenase [ubiquinone] 1 alpha subcomplex subunit 12 [Septoria linicola]|uniref:NADH dehydrogenase [ubiquinone] 1 alpha subcomplex subunit 12 n=1 Tax=Septoria linicola TaxID=215465 RepID=A0A9Q9AQJ2_9PEZI|nr:putative NADH dehydrogenase [ubiquinone] 1 alpha subcomplex subunit 12 [Septoria linicola]USW53599.1 Putative NADH dehydrogenase [ubiquinone] 1 alpha subcomplex subunit 12 [Septoria linicola]
MPQPGLISRAWFKWKALRLPWRKTFLIGFDLSGNTFWEFKDALNAGRMRRIVKYSNKTPHYSDVKVTPQWHQWLRHTRDEPPTISEQQLDISRQAMMKQLAAEADERWNSKPSFLDAPTRNQPQAATGLKDPGGYAPQTEPEAKQGVRSAVDEPEKVEAASQGKQEGLDEGRFKGTKTRDRKENPWEKLQPKGNAGENWQPQGWTPAPAQRGR